MKLLFHPIAWSVIVGTFLSRAVYYMVYPYLAMYLGQVKGLDAVTIGVILGVSSLVGTLSSFLGGVWADRFGRYPVMIASISLWSLVFVGFVYADAPWAFLLLNALNGLCRNVFEPTARVLLSDVTPKEQSLSVFSARYYAINAGAAIGPLLGVAFGSAASTTPFYLTALINALYGLGIVALMLRYAGQFEQKAQTPIPIKESIRVIATDRFFRYYLLGNLFIYAAYSHLETTLSQYMGNNPYLPDGVQLYAYLLLANALIVLALQMPVTKWAARFQPLTCVRIGSVMFALSLLGFGLFSSLIPLVVSVLFFTVGEILCFVVGDVVIDRHAPEHLRGTYFGASGLSFLGQSAGPWIGGMLLEQLGLGQGTLIFGILMGCTLLALPVFYWGERGRRETMIRGEVGVSEPSS